MWAFKTSEHSSRYDTYHAITDSFKRAHADCTIEFFRVNMLEMVKSMNDDYTDSCLNDAMHLTQVAKALNDPKFKKEGVWQQWFYIRELIIKYIDSNDDRVKSLDKGMQRSFRVKLNKWLAGDEMKANKKMDRPEINITRADWERFEQRILNLLLDDCAEIFGLEEPVKTNWKYEDVFDKEPERLTRLIGI